MNGFGMQAAREGSRIRFALSGELDDAAARRLRDIDLDELAGSGCMSVSIELGELEFIDSSGIGSLVNLRNRATARGVIFEVGAVPTPIERTLVMAGLADLFGLDPRA
ncbi:STAS domain-containing protein [Jatrophihabitans fulvus]